MDTVERKRYEELFDLYTQMGKERDAALSRAEAAEQRVAELEAQRDDYHMKWVDVGFELGQFADDLIAVLKLQLTDNDDEATTLATIVTRVTELEAQLDAQEWRSGDEVPHEEGWYQTFNWGMYGHLYFSGGRWSKYPVPPKHWRSVGPPPSGDDSPG